MRRSVWLWCVGCFLWLPVIVVVLRAFSGSAFAIQDLTAEAFVEVWSESRSRSAIVASILIAGCVSAASVLLAVATTFCLLMFIEYNRPVVWLALLFPLLVPEIIFAVGYRFGLSLVGLVGGYVEVGFAQLPYGYLYALALMGVGAMKAELDLTPISLSLGATRFVVAARVLLPSLRPNALGALLLVFLLSLDDFILAFFAAGPGTVTVPLHIYASLRRGFSPAVFALAALLAIVSVVGTVAGDRLLRRR